MFQRHCTAVTLRSFFYLDVESPRLGEVMCCATMACDRWIWNVFLIGSGRATGRCCEFCDVFCAESPVASLLGCERASRKGFCLRASRPRCTHVENGLPTRITPITSWTTRSGLQHPIESTNIRVIHSNCLCPHTTAPKLHSHEIQDGVVQH